MKSRLIHPVLKAVALTILTILLNPCNIFSADITGTWQAEFNTEIGVQNYVFLFSRTEEGFTGTANSDIGGQKNEVKLTEVKLDSNRISFVEALPFQGMELTIRYDGTVSENEMKLNRHVGDFVTEKLIAKRSTGEEKQPE